MEARLEKTLAAEPQGVQDAFKYLSEQPYQLWGDYLITDPWRRLEAARWLHEQVRGVTKVSRLRRR